MKLSPNVLNILANIKAELLSKSEPENDDKSVMITLLPKKKEPKTTVFMRHARVRGQAFQRMCQRREF